MKLLRVLPQRTLCHVSKYYQKKKIHDYNIDSIFLRWEGTDMQKTILDNLSSLIADIYRDVGHWAGKKWPCVLQCCELGKPSVVDFNSVESTSWLERVAAICTISGNFINRFLVAFCYSFIEWLHVREIIFKLKLKRSATQINEPEKREISITDFIYLHHVY